jgi:DNA gyrase/topoisomerase IV subunit A
MLRLVKKEDLQGGKRGRRGVNIKPPKNANLINTLYTTNLGIVAAFTNAGRMYNFSLADLDYGKDYSVYELIMLQDNEKVLLLIDTTSFNSYHNLVTISKKGYIKKTATREYNVRAKKGTAVMKLDSDDQLIGVYLSINDEDKIFIASSSGNYNFYKLDELSTTGRLTKGVKAIKLVAQEYIRAATLVKKDIEYRGLLTITTTGKGKITKIEDFNTTSRAVKGSQVMALKDENLATVFAVPISQEKIFITTNNKAVLLNVDSIPIQNRVTSGVRIIDGRGIESEIEIM